MKTDEIRIALRECMSLAFDCELSALEGNPDIYTCPHWDSFSHLRLILAVEERFGVRFWPEETAAKGIYAILDFSTLAAAIEAKLTEPTKRPPYLT